MSLKTALIGYGLGGRVFHAPLIDAVEELELVAVATSRADAVLGAWPGVQVVDADSVISDPAIELIVISTPNDTHFSLAEAALRAGKHIVVDKPLTTTSAQAKALAGLASERKLILSPFHNRRWDGDFLTVKRIIDGGQLGHISLFEARWDRFRPDPKGGWRESDRPGAGLLADLGPHLIDQALALFGLPEALWADIATQRRGTQADDYFELTLFYGARRVILSAGLLAADPRPRFSAHGNLGSFVKSGIDPQEQWMKGGGTPGGHRDDPDTFGMLTTAEGRHAIETDHGDYRDYYRGVARAITTGCEPPVRDADAIATIELLELASMSHEQGRRLDLRWPTGGGRQ